MKTIVRIKFGSELYGTSTADSDVDLRSVHLPSARDILLQRAKATINNRADPKMPVDAGELDHVDYALHAFVKACLTGQLLALDLLFAPTWAVDDSFTEAGAELWRRLVEKRTDLLLHKGAGFLGYCFSRCSKYEAIPANPLADWKGLYHDVRIASQVLEFMRTGFVTFPRPEARYLIAVKTGEASFLSSAYEARSLFRSIADLADSLPDNPAAKEWSESFVESAYRDEVRA